MHNAMANGLRLLCCFIVVAVSPASAQTTLFSDSCNVGDTRISIAKNKFDQSGFELKLSISGDEMPAFRDLTSAEYEVGEVVMSRCLASSFVFVFNYGSPYLKGFAYRKCGRLLDRIDFAEKTLPIALSRCSEPLFAVFRNDGSPGYTIVDASRTVRVPRIQKDRVFRLGGERGKP